MWSGLALGFREALNCKEHIKTINTVYNALQLHSFEVNTSGGLGTKPCAGTLQSPTRRLAVTTCGTFSLEFVFHFILLLFNTRSN